MVDPERARAVRTAAAGVELTDDDVEAIAGCPAFLDDLVTAVGIRAARARLRSEPFDLPGVLAKLHGPPSPQNRWRALGPAFPLSTVLRDLRVPREPWAEVLGVGPPEWVMAWVDGLRVLPPVTVVEGPSDVVDEFIERAALAYALTGTPVLWHGRQNPPVVGRRLFNRLAHPSGRPSVARLAAAPLWRDAVVVSAEPAGSLARLPEVLARARDATPSPIGAVVGDGMRLEPGDRSPALDVAVVAAGTGGTASVQATDAGFVVDGTGSSAVVFPFPSAAGRPEPVVDTTGAYCGWRLWFVGHDASGPFLGSPVISSPWPRGVIEAACATDTPCPEPPQRHCSCGVYAFADPASALAEWNHARGFVLGQVRMWGRVAVHHGGYRSSHAQVLLLLAPSLDDDDRRRLADRYECPVLGHPDEGHAPPVPVSR